MGLYGRARALAHDLKYRFPKRVACNICRWSGREFASDEWHPRTVCRRCNSEVRHRLLAAALRTQFPGLLAAKRVLHFAPEPVLTDLFRRSAAHYKTANIDGSADLKLDMTSMPEAADGSYDIAVACDVLEHVSNDLNALTEMRRILSPKGWAIITVPQKDNLADTFEDASITDPKEREQIFGQWNHLRIYGQNFPSIIERAGFTVAVISEAVFPSSQVKRNVLFPPIRSEHPLATNYRKVFFASQRD